MSGSSSFRQIPNDASARDLTADGLAHVEQDERGTGYVDDGVSADQIPRLMRRSEMRPAPIDPCSTGINASAAGFSKLCLAELSRKCAVLICDPSMRILRRNAVNDRS